MTDDSAYEVILGVCSRKHDEFDEPGDAWILRPDPDTAMLYPEMLAEAIGLALLERGLLR